MAEEMAANIAARLNLVAVETILSTEIRTVLTMLSGNLEKEKGADESETTTN